MSLDQLLEALADLQENDSEDDEHPYLYHVTYHSHLPSIARRGLLPGHGNSIGRTNQANSTGQVFLTHPKGVLFWHSKAEQHASDQSDHPESEGLTPVVLRVPKNDVRKPKEDEIGTKDAGYVPAVKTSKKVAATNLEVFHKGKWKPVEHHWRINPLRSYRKEPGEEGEKDLYYPKEHHENPLHPQPEHLGLKYW